MSWTKVNLPFGPKYKYNRLGEERLISTTFLGKYGLVPGMVLEVEHRNCIDKKTAKEIVLVGHINALNGVCDDCMLFDDKDKVIRFRKIDWKKE